MYLFTKLGKKVQVVREILILQHSFLKVADISGPFFEKKYEAVPYIFFTNILLSD